MPLTGPSPAAAPFALRTGRLELLPFAPADAAQLHRILTDPDVRRFLLDGDVVSMAWVEAEIASSRASFDRRGYGLWRVLLRGGETAGFAGFREFHDPPQLELLYGLDPRFWGRGLATEAGRAVIRYGFAEVGLRRILASTDAPNAASIRVMERLGMRFVGREMLGGRETLRYALERPDWMGDG